MPILLEHEDKVMFYIEPFVGGGNSIEQIPGDKLRRIGFDVFPPVIQALKLIRDNLDCIPRNNSEFTEDDYKKMMQTKDHVLYGLVMHEYSWGGKYRGGWARCSGVRDYVATCRRAAEAQNKLIQGVELGCTDYKNIKLDIIKKAIIYCDPPYQNTTKYKTGEFNHSEFWQWVRDRVKEGHYVYVSAYNAPDDFICVWQKEQKTTIDNVNKRTIKAVEKLFIHESMDSSYGPVSKNR